MTVEELRIVISSQTEKAQAKVNKLKETVSRLQQNKATDVNITTTKAQANIKKLQNELDRVRAKAQKIQDSMAVNFAKQDEIINNYKGMPRHSNMSKDASLESDLKNDPQFAKLNTQIDQQEASLRPLTARMRELRQGIAQVSTATGKMAPVTEKAGNQTKKFGNSIKASGGHVSYYARMVKSMLLSMILYSGVAAMTKSLTEGMQNLAQGSRTANATISNLSTSFLYVRNSIASSFLPILQALGPIIIQVSDWIVNLFNTIGMLTARIFNNATTYTRAKRAQVDYAASLNKTGAAAKSASKSLASFDQLNILNKSQSAADATPGMPSPSDMFENVQIPQDVANTADQIKGTIANLTTFISGAVLAIGAVLVFTGANIPLGLGLMVLGAVGLASSLTANWDDTKTNVGNVVNSIAGVVSGALLALGAVLAFSGADVPLGIGMMLVGASVLASAVALNWSGMSDQMRSTITEIAVIVGAALLVLGAVLTFSGANIPMGIGMMIAGVVSLGTAAALNWNSIKNQVKSVLADILAIASLASIAIGLILCLTGAGIPLGIGLILAGVAGVSAAHQISSNPITDWAKGLINGVIGIFETGVNFIISMLNKISVNVPDWVPWIGGKTFGFNIGPLHIPRLAQGAVVTSPHLVMAGDDGAEAFVPLEHNTGWISKVAVEIQKRGGTASGGDRDIVLDMPVYLDQGGDFIGTIRRRIYRAERAEG